jgi:hypothetical protein
VCAATKALVDSIVRAARNSGAALKSSPRACLDWVAPPALPTAPQAPLTTAPVPHRQQAKTYTAQRSCAHGDGRLGLDDPITRHLPAPDLASPAAMVTN